MAPVGAVGVGEAAGEGACDEDALFVAATATAEVDAIW